MCVCVCVILPVFVPSEVGRCASGFLNCLVSWLSTLKRAWHSGWQALSLLAQDPKDSPAAQLDPLKVPGKPMVTSGKRCAFFFFFASFIPSNDL